MRFGLTLGVSALQNTLFTLKILLSVPELGGLWKQEKNPACTQECKSLRSVQAAQYAETEAAAAEEGSLPLHVCRLPR